MNQHFLSGAGRWFLDSGIQHDSGGVARYYLIDPGKNQPVSNEITGYAVSSLLDLYERLGWESLLLAARRAAHFLIAQVDPDGRIPYEPGSPLVYFFDCGMIARGLLRLHRVDGDLAMRDAALRIGRFMAREFPLERGCACILGQPPEPWWSRTPGCFQLKAALAWWELAEWDPVLRACYERQLAFSLDVWRELIDREPDLDKRMDRLHPLCYFLEGLGPVMREHSGVAREAIALCGTLLREIEPRFVRSDVYAQLLRAQMLAGFEAVPNGELAAALAPFQDASGSPRLDGGFCFGRRNGQMLPFSNPVSTAFGAQALAWQETGVPGDGWRALV